MTVALVFPGQGAQHIGMGYDLYNASAAARAVFDQADETLGFALSRLCFTGPEAALTATENAQPALLATSMALLAALREAGHHVAPALLAGHSLGEYSALVAAGALDLPTALRLVRLRGELMAAAHQGGMAAIVGLGEEALEAACRAASSAGAPVVIANYNAPGQLVISGASAAVERAGTLAKERGAKRVLPLKVSAAFHSPLMRAAADGLAVAVAQAAVADAGVPVIANVIAEPIADAQAIRAELVTQVIAPVRWIASIRYAVAAGVDTFVEVGAGSVLTGLIKRIAPAARLVNVAERADLDRLTVL
jgi:[acyl-carrier-protein] S-malonyltransferase